jgi:hypothetical protein
MWETVNAPRGMTTAQAVTHIIRANLRALQSENSPLENVVINCHGADGGGALYIGGEDHIASRLNLEQVGPFSWLKSFNIGTIWLVACQAAAGGLGKRLCQAIAKAANCQVVAADEDQETGWWGTWRLMTSARHGQIDEFEGTVYRFTVVGHWGIINPHDAIFTILE